MPIGGGSGSLGVTLPEIGSTSWSTINTELQKVIDAVEAQVTPSGININANVEFNGYLCTEVGAIQLDEQDATLAVQASNALKLYAYNDELYFSDGDAAQVQITSGGSLNAAALGGIVGDYSGDAAKVTYVASTSTFVLTQDPGISAKLDTGDILLRECAASAYAITIKSPTSLASAYSVTMPTALPASTSLVMMSSAGELSTSLTPTLTSVTTTGAAAVGTTLNVTGATTLTGGVTGAMAATGAVSGASVTTAEAACRHGEQSVMISAAAAIADGTNSAFVGTSGAAYVLASGALGFVHIPIQVPAGSRIKSLSFGVTDTAAGLTVRFYKYNALGSGAGNPAASTQVGSNTSPALAAYYPVVISGLTETVSNEWVYYGYVLFGASTQRFHGLKVVYDRVA